MKSPLGLVQGLEDQTYLEQTCVSRLLLSLPFVFLIFKAPVKRILPSSGPCRCEVKTKKIMKLYVFLTDPFLSLHFSVCAEKSNPLFGPQCLVAPARAEADAISQPTGSLGKMLLEDFLHVLKSYCRENRL